MVKELTFKSFWEKETNIKTEYKNKEKYNYRSLSEMSSPFNNIKVIDIIYKWRIHFIVIVLATCVFSVIFSGPTFIQEKYKSTAIIYPSNIIPYASETPTEQMVQLLNSRDIHSAIIKEFDLANHYNIDTSSKHANDKIIKEFSNNIRIRKTEYESIQIDVLDTEPEFACDMVNGMIEKLNLKARSLQREKTAEVVIILKDKLNKKKIYIDSLETRLDSFRTKHNILDYTIQTEEYTKGYMRAITQNSSIKNKNQIKGYLKDLGLYGGDFLLLGGYLSSATGAYNEIILDYEQAVSDLNKELSYTNVVTKPIVSDKKIYPIRWLIVLISAIAAFFISFIVVTVIDNISNSSTRSEAVK